MALAVAAGLVVFSFYLIAYLGFNVGDFLEENLGSFGFLGNFIFQLSDILRMITPVLAALAVGGVLGNFGGRMGQYVSDRWSPKVEDSGKRICWCESNNSLQERAKPRSYYFADRYYHGRSQRDRT